MPLDEVIEDKRFHVKYQNEEFKVSKEQGFPQVPLWVLTCDENNIIAILHVIDLHLQLLKYV